MALGCGRLLGRVATRLDEREHSGGHTDGDPDLIRVQPVCEQAGDEHGREHEDDRTGYLGDRSLLDAQQGDEEPAEVSDQ